MPSTQTLKFRKNNYNSMQNRFEKGSFDGLGIAPKLIEILDRINFKVPTPIQHKAIPVAISGQDVIGIAQTGTGKTLAYSIPLIQHIIQKNLKGLVILPTRELALQVNAALSSLCRPLHLKTAVFIGGESMGRQLSDLKRKPEIIVATPGRLIDHLERKTIHLNKVGILILDEADRMLDMGFLPQIKRILQTVPRDRLTMLFSATMPPEIVQIATSYMKLPVRVEVAPAGTVAKKITQEVFFVTKESKFQLLEKVLNDYKDSVLIFTRTKFGARKIARFIKGIGHTAAEIHSDRSLSQRKEALQGFKVGKYRILVATDIAARGIDVSRIELVINFDLPDNSEDYVHRIGRTGRAGHEGHAISFATSNQKRDIRNIERLIKKTLPISGLPLLPPKRASIKLHNHTDIGKPSKPRRFKRHLPRKRH